MSSNQQVVFSNTDKLFTGALVLRPPTAVSAAKARHIDPESYYPAWAKTVPEHVGWMATIVAHCTSLSIEEREWKTLVASYTDAALEMPKEAFPPSMFVPLALSESLKKDIRGLGTFLCKYHKENYPDESWAEVSALRAPIVPGFPMPLDDRCSWMSTWGDSRAMYAHFAMIVFLMGKTVTESNREGIVKNRPNALIRAYRLENSAEALSGESQRLSKRAMEFIPLAWEALSPTRISLVMILADSFGTATSTAVSIILLNFQLMAWSGASYAPMIHNFLVAYPWAAREQAFVAAARHFVSSAEVLLRAGSPAVIPYYRVILRSQAGLVFSRKLLGSLVGAAVTVLRRNEQSMANYFLSPEELESGSLFSSIEARFEKSSRSIVAPPQSVEVPLVEPTAPAVAPAPEPEHEVEEGDGERAVETESKKTATEWDAYKAAMEYSQASQSVQAETPAAPPPAEPPRPIVSLKGKGASRPPATPSKPKPSAPFGSK